MKKTVFKLALAALGLTLTSGLSAQCNLNVTSFEVQAECNNGMNGSAQATGDFGVAPYDVEWQDEMSTTVLVEINVDQGIPSTLQNVKAGLYTVTFIDALGACTVTDTVEITTGLTPNLSISSSIDETCAQNDGSATINPIDGSGSFDIMWDAATGNQTTPTAIGLTSGNYDVTVTDNVSGCAASTTVFVANGCGTIPTTRLIPTDCNITLSAVDQLLHIDMVPNATDYEYRVENILTGQVFTQMRGNAEDDFWMSSVAGVEYDMTYNVSVRAQVGNTWGNYGHVCQITTPDDTAATTSLTAPYCGIVVDSLSSVVEITPVMLATDYEYYFVNATTGDIFTTTRGNDNPDFPLGGAPLAYESVYEVQVRAIINNKPQTFGPACEIMTPAFPTTELRSDFCGINLTSFNQDFFCTEVVGAQDYEWIFVSHDDGSIISRYRYAPTNDMNMASVPGIMPNTTYDVQVRAMVQNIWGDYGIVCTLTTPSSGNFVINNNAVAETSTLGFANGTMPAKPSLQVGPNPNDGQFFKVNMIAEEGFSGRAEVTVTDLNGRLMFSRQVEMNNAPVNMHFEQPLASGIYLVNVRIGETITTERLFVR